MAEAPKWVRLKTLADEMGYKLFSVKRALQKAGIQIVQVHIAGQRPRDAVAVEDAERWKKSLQTPGVIQ